MIRAARERRRLTQRELATLLGLTGGAINQWELGKNNPTLANLSELARVLDLPMTTLVRAFRNQKASRRP